MRAPEPVRGKLTGHLTEVSLARELALIAKALHATREPRPVLLDCTEMKSYELAARHAFVEWSRAERTRVTRMAIVTDNRLWHVVISAMSLASGQKMMGFSDESEAERWLGEKS